MKNFIQSEYKSKEYYQSLLKNKEFLSSIKKIEQENNKELDELRNNFNPTVSDNLVKKVGKEVCRKFGLDLDQARQIVWSWYCNKPLTIEDLLISNSLCSIIDLKGEFEKDIIEGGGVVLSHDIEEKLLDYDIYPIVLKISPYATQRDLIDLIKKNYSSVIKPIQDKNKVISVGINKIRFRDKLIQERNDFIFKNRKLPYKKIVSLVMSKFSDKLSGKNLPDEGTIGKIISMMNKTRK